MAIELKETDLPGLMVAEGRNNFIENTRRYRNFLRRRNLPLNIFIRGIAFATLSRAELRGRKNLDLIKSKIGIEQITGAANHTSDVNHEMLDYVLSQRGYPELADRLAFAAGLKMWDRWYTRWAMPCLSTYPVAAPGYYDELEDLLRLSLSDEKLLMLEKYQSNMDWLNRASLRAVRPAWQRGELIPIVYPETTRSEDGLLKRGREETEIYFRNGVILPFMIEGDDKVFPPRQNFKLDKILRGEFEVCVTAGEPINGKVLKSSRVQDWLKERRATTVDFVTSRIGRINRNRIDPQIRPLCESLWEDIPNGVILEAA